MEKEKEEENCNNDYGDEYGPRSSAGGDRNKTGRTTTTEEREKKMGKLFVRR